MKRDKTVGVVVTLEELKLLRKKIRQVEDADDKTYSMSSFIRSKLLLPYLNGDSPPSVPESKQEDKENVSPGLMDTFEKQSKEFDFNLDDE